MKQNINIQINIRRRITFGCRLTDLNVTRENTKILLRSLRLHNISVMRRERTKNELKGKSGLLNVCGMGMKKRSLKCTKRPNCWNKNRLSTTGAISRSQNAEHFLNN
jgi:hypothetical protein